MTLEELDLLLAEGEGLTVEFKERFTPRIDRDLVALANAVIHREYGVRGTSLMVEVHEDRVVIKNPGGFPAGMSRQKIGDLSVRRNELIADMFARMHRVERMGSGFRRIRESMEKAGLPFPTISSNGFFIIEFSRPPLAELAGNQSSVKSSVKIIDLIRQYKDITIPVMAERLNLTTRAVEKQLEKLQTTGRVRRVGPDKGGHWEITEIKGGENT